VSGPDLEVIQRRLDELEARVRGQADPNRMNMLVFESSRDRLLAAFVIATSAASLGMQVDMFFAFWATAALKADRPQVKGKSLVEWAFGWMLPRGSSKTPLSQMDMCGMGRWLMQREMKAKNIADLDSLIATAGELGVKIHVCEMSMRLMGIRQEELIDYPELKICGGTTFAELTTRANTTLFI